MTVDELYEAFETASNRPYDFNWKPSGEFGTQRPDLHAFLLLEKLLPGSDGDIVTAAEHDEIWLDIDVEALAAVITIEQIEELDSCGVMADEDHDGLHMFA